MKYRANPVEVEAFKITNDAPMLEADQQTGFELMLEGKSWPVFADLKMTARMTPLIGDYWVIQSDGYVYLNPKDVFGRKYSPIDESKTVLQFTAEQLKALKNVLVWADLYDCQKNLGKNQAVFEVIRNTFDYTTEGQAAIL